MKVTLAEALEMIERGETPEQYKARTQRFRRLQNERYDLEDAISVLEENGNCEKDSIRLEKKRARLAKVMTQLEALR